MFASILVALAAVTVNPLPDKAQIGASTRLVRSVYREDLASDDGLKKILDAADATMDDPAGQAAMYLAVAHRAADDGKLRIAFDAVDRLARRFDYDALAAKTSMLGGAVKHAKTINARTSIVNRAFELLDEAIADEQFDAAGDALKVATAIVPRLRDVALRKELAAKRKELDRLEREREAGDKAHAAALATLKSHPNDPAANETLGAHMASQGDWRRAIGHFTHAADDDLREAASLDASAAADPKWQLRAADAWWNVADGADGKEQHAYRSRAVYWYSLAMPSMTGLLRARAEKRIAAAGKVDLAGQSSGGDDKVTILLAPGVPLVLVKIPASADGKVKSFWLGQTEVTQGQWKAVMGSNSPSSTIGNLPVCSVTPPQTLDFLRQLEPLNARFRYRLPEKDEMEHAYQSGHPYEFYFEHRNEYIWMLDNCKHILQPVATKKPNEYGLFDMLGNGWEWLSDSSAWGGSVFQTLEEYKRRVPTLSAKTLAGGANGVIGFRVAAQLR